MSDKGDTFIFKPEQPEEKPVEKPKIARTDVDEFTIARTVREEDEENEGKISSLTYIAATLGALLVIAIVVLVIFLSTDEKEVPQEIPQNNQEVTVPTEDKEGEEEEEKAPTITTYTLGYNGGKIYDTENGGYSVVFEVYNEKGDKVESKKFFVNEDTVIKDQGNKMQLGSFISLIENQAGEIIILDCSVNEEESTILTITYSSSGYGEEEEEEVVEEEPEEEEKPVEETPVEDTPADTPPVVEEEQTETEETTPVEETPVAETPAEVNPTE